MRKTLPAMMAAHTVTLSSMPVAGTSVFAVFASVLVMVTRAGLSLVPEIFERIITNLFPSVAVVSTVTFSGISAGT